MKTIVITIVSIFIVNGCGSNIPQLSSDASSYELSDYKKTIYHQLTADSINGVEIFSSKLAFKEIDSESYESMLVVGMQMFVDKHHSIVLKSGKHRIKYYYDVYFIRSATMNFEKGHKYLFDAQVVLLSQYRRKIQTWVYDLTDKKVVFGLKPETIKYK
jgi:hypothetical protein